MATTKPWLTQILFVYGLCFALGFSCYADTGPIKLHYKVLKQLPHNRQSFTQGLVFINDVLFESSGLYGRSFAFQYDTTNAQTLNHTFLPKEIFAEGLALLGTNLYLLTWQKGVLFTLNANTLEIQNQIYYQGEGWGLTHDQTQFYMSNGSDRISVRTLQNFTEIKTIAVRKQGKPVKRINELEFARDLLWANIWQTNEIIVIDPNTGVVLASLDLTELVNANSVSPGDTVLNGIAYNPASDSFWVTGKLWPTLYELEISPTPKPTHE